MTLRIRGELRKAYRDAEGTPVLEVLVTGPELDRGITRPQERIGATARSKALDLAKAGKLPLVPSHDVPLELAKSIDGALDDGGHLIVTYQIDPADTLAMRLHKGVETGSWKGQVSLGATTCTRQQVKDDELQKTVTEVTDFEAEGAHVALAFPGKAVYPFAGITAALYKAERQHDTGALVSRGWSSDSLEKATDADGAYIPPTFAERKQRQDLQEELPGMLDILRYTLEDITSPWTGGDKRALLRKTFAEFESAVLGEVLEAQQEAPEVEEAVVKAEAEQKLSEAEALAKAVPAVEPAAVEPPRDTVTKAEAEELAKAAVTGALAPVMAALDELRKALPPAAPTPHIPDTTEPIHTGRVAEVTGQTQPQSAVNRLASLRKAIEAERDPARRHYLESVHNDLVMGLARTMETT